MIKTLKVLGLAIAVAVFFTMASTASRADDINFGGAVTFAGQGCSGTPVACTSQNVSFTTTTVLSTNPSPDSLTGATMTLPNFNLSLSGSTPVFTPSSGTIAINGGAAGSLSGTISWMDIVQGGVSGAYNLNVGLSGITGTHGTSNVLGAFLTSGQGSGLVTLQFTVNTQNVPSTIQQLVTLDTSTPLQSSESGSITTPEPASLLLLGTGLLGCAFLVRRKMLAA